jgi:transposase
MPKQLNFQLTAEGFALLEKALNTDKRPEVRQRATALRLLPLGHKVAEVAEMVAVTPATIYDWVKRWQAGGLDRLANQPKRPPPRKADAAYQAAAEATLATDPAELGYDFPVWTVERLRDHLEAETGVRLSTNWLGSKLKAWGYVYRRPKHDMTQLQDPAAKAQARAWLDELKRGRWRTISGCSLWTKPP